MKQKFEEQLQSFMIQMDGVKVSIFSSFIAQFYWKESTIAYFDNIPRQWT